MKDVQNSELPSLPLGKNVDASTSSVGQLWGEAKKNTLVHLYRLHQEQLDLAAGKDRVTLSHKLNFQQLEMLEAELANQGLLNRAAGDDHCSLAQHAQHQASLWSWRAERFGVMPDCLSYEIDVDRYLVTLAEELLAAVVDSTANSSAAYAQAGVWNRATDTQKAALFQLQYLECFAAFLNGAYENTVNRYQRGLNVVLRVLSNAARVRREETESAELVAEGFTPNSAKEIIALKNSTEPTGKNYVLQLPLCKQDFFRKLKEFRNAN